MMVERKTVVRSISDYPLLIKRQTDRALNESKARSTFLNQKKIDDQSTAHAAKEA